MSSPTASRPPPCSSSRRSRRSRSSPRLTSSARCPTSCSSRSSRSRCCAAASPAPSAASSPGLIVDTATLGTLGLTSLVLTLAGFWIGRYGETTGRDRAHAPFLSVAVVTVLYELGLLVVHFVLGESAPAGAVVTSLVPAIVLNLILTAPGLRARAAAAAARSSATELTRGGAAPWLARRQGGRPRGAGPPRRTRARDAVEPYRLTPKLARRSRSSARSLLIGFAALFMRFWALQVLAGRSTPHARRRTRSARSVSRRRAARSSTSNGDVLVAEPSRSRRSSSLRRACRRSTPTRVAELRALRTSRTASGHEHLTKLIVARRKVGDVLDPIVVRTRGAAGRC